MHLIWLKCENRIYISNVFPDYNPDPPLNAATHNLKLRHWYSEHTNCSDCDVYRIRSLLFDINLQFDED